MNKEEVKRVIDLIESIKEFRINNNLPFGTCDYYEMDTCIEILKKLESKKESKKS